MRLIPVVWGVLPPNAPIPDQLNGTLITRWQHDPLFLLADSGVSVLAGLAEPYWHTGHVHGRTHIGYGLLGLNSVLALLLVYGLGSVALAAWSARRRARSGQGG